MRKKTRRGERAPGFNPLKLKKNMRFFCKLLSNNSNEVNFIITDFKNEINVTYSGAVPNLFAEGKGVVAEGFLKDKNYFSATKILAKHDENYMPPEVKEALGVK